MRTHCSPLLQSPSSSHASTQRAQPSLPATRASPAVQLTGAHAVWSATRHCGVPDGHPLASQGVIQTPVQSTRAGRSFLRQCPPFARQTPVHPLSQSVPEQLRKQVVSLAHFAPPPSQSVSSVHCVRDAELTDAAGCADEPPLPFEAPPPPAAPSTTSPDASPVSLSSSMPSVTGPRRPTSRS